MIFFLNPNLKKKTSLAIFEYRFQILYVKIREFLYTRMMMAMIKEQPKLEVGDVNKDCLAKQIKF